MSSPEENSGPVVSPFNDVPADEENFRHWSFDIRHFPRPVRAIGIWISP
jgi:hypothetical protein